MKEMLTLENLSKSYGSKPVLSGISRSFVRGKIYGIIGRNGAGKTTLFNCINRDIPFDSGTISYTDQDFQSHPISFENVGFVSASPLLPDFLSGFEFIKFFVEFDKSIDVSEKSDEAIHSYFDLVQIDYDDRFKLIRNYSYGMKNKVQLLCSLIRKPKILLLDEPLSSFDIIVSQEIKQLLFLIKKDHIILMSTHILQLAIDICDEILLLKDGKLFDASWNRHNQDDFENYIVQELASSEHTKK